MSNRTAWIIFTRVPEPGKTKTRLMPYYSSKECAELHEAFLKDIREAIRIEANSDIDIFVAYNGDFSKLKPIFREEVRYFTQEGQSLGERMQNAFEFVFEQGYKRVVLIGTDVPHVAGQGLTRATRVLDSADFVIGPTVDGGYWLIGMNQLVDGVFSMEKYGHDNVLQQTLGELPFGVIAEFLPETFDIDYPDDLRRYFDGIIEDSFTRRYIVENRKISVIIPTYNESKIILNFLKELEKFQDRAEIIFADGGSTDGTRELIKENIKGKPQYKLIYTTKGRAAQMNAGAKESNGDILLFLHSDIILPANPVDEILHEILSCEWGCFGIKFRSKNFFMLTNRIISNFRAKRRRIIFGDQGMFIERNVFFRLGQFPILPIMEDFQFSLDARKVLGKTRLTKSRLLVSDRRYRGNTITKLKMMKQMHDLRKMYINGRDVSEISDIYRDIR